MIAVLQEQIIVGDDRTGLHVETLKRTILNNLFYITGCLATSASRIDYYTATGLYRSLLLRNARFKN